MSPKNRINAISIMRVIAMIMVVAYHSLLYYTGQWWYFGGDNIPFWGKAAKFLNVIDMPMFVFISGFLFGHLYLYKKKYRDTKLFLKKKAVRLLVPYLFWGLFIVITESSIYPWKLLFTGIAHLWFLLMLFWTFSIAIVYMKLIGESTTMKNINVQITIVLGLYAILLLYKSFIPFHYLLCIENTLNYLPIFYIGIFCAQNKLYEFHNRNVIIFTISDIIVLASWIFLFNTKESWVDDIIIRILSYSLIISIFLLFNKVSLDGCFFKLVKFLDKYSLGLYIFNQIIVNIALQNKVFNLWMNTHHITGPLILFTISFFIPLALSILFHRTKITSLVIGE